MVMKMHIGAIIPSSGGKKPLIDNFVSIKNNPHIIRQNKTKINPSLAIFVYLSRLGV